MAFQAGGPHAQDRGLEAVATAWAEMTRAPASAIWEKPQGKAAPLVIEKHWRMVPRGVALVIGCQTFPTWNSYPGLFASLATGNTVIVKPHPGATLPLALTVAVLRDLLAEEGLPRDVVLLAADAAGSAESPRTSSATRRSRSSTIPARTPSAPGSARTRARRRSTPRRQASIPSSSRPVRLRRHVRECRLLARALLGPDVHRATGHLRPRRRDRDRRGPQVLRGGRRRHRRRGRHASRRPLPRPGRRRRHRQPRDTRPHRGGARGSAASSATAPPSPKGAALPR